MLCLDWGVDHGVPEPGAAGDAGDDHVGIFDDGGLVGEENLVPERLLDQILTRVRVAVAVVPGAEDVDWCGRLSSK